MDEIRFNCPDCGQLISIECDFVGMEICCSSCAGEVMVPAESTVDVENKPSASKSAEPATASIDGESGEDEIDGIPDFTEHIERDLTCPVCWTEFEAGDLMHIAVHDDLIGDPIIGPDERQRFLATRFNEVGHALDAMGIPCSESPVQIAGGDCLPDS